MLTDHNEERSCFCFFHPPRQPPRQPWRQRPVSLDVIVVCSLFAVLVVNSHLHGRFAQCDSFFHPLGFFSNLLFPRKPAPYVTHSIRSGTLSLMPDHPSATCHSGTPTHPPLATSPPLTTTTLTTSSLFKGVCVLMYLVM